MDGILVVVILTDIEYADETTLERALEGRREY
jgi:recombinational DNA repair protein RecR